MFHSGSTVEGDFFWKVGGSGGVLLGDGSSSQLGGWVKEVIGCTTSLSSLRVNSMCSLRAKHSGDSYKRYSDGLDAKVDKSSILANRCNRGQGSGHPVGALLADVKQSDSFGTGSFNPGDSSFGWPRAKILVWPILHLKSFRVKRHKVQLFTITHLINNGRERFKIVDNGIWLCMYLFLIVLCTECWGHIFVHLYGFVWLHCDWFSHAQNPEYIVAFGQEGITVMIKWKCNIAIGTHVHDSRDRNQSETFQQRMSANSSFSRMIKLKSWLYFIFSLNLAKRWYRRND